MRASIVIPIQNEAEVIGTTAAAVRALEQAGRDHEVIVVDDASSDGTAGRSRISARSPSERWMPAF